MEIISIMGIICIGLDWNGMDCIALDCVGVYAGWESDLDWWWFIPRIPFFLIMKRNALFRCAMVDACKDEEKA